MSYYMMGIQFWSGVSLLFALLPLLAVATSGIARIISRAFATPHAPAALEPHRRGLLCRMSNARWG